MSITIMNSMGDSGSPWQTSLVVDEIPRHAIQDLGRGGCKQASDNLSPNPSKAQPFKYLQEKGLINRIEFGKVL
jgi:hypothetical protein